MTKNEELFAGFLSKLAKKSGQTTLIEAVKKGYRVCFENYEDRVFDNGDTMSDEDMMYANPSWYDVYVDGELEHSHVSENALDGVLRMLDGEGNVQYVPHGEPLNGNAKQNNNDTASSNRIRFAESNEKLNWPYLVDDNEFSDNPKAYVVLKAIHDALYNAAEQHDLACVVGYNNVGNHNGMIPEILAPLPTWDSLKSIVSIYSERYDDSNRYSNGSIKLDSRFFGLKFAMQTYAFTRYEEGKFIKHWATYDDDRWEDDFMAHLEDGLSPECAKAVQNGANTPQSLADYMGWKKEWCGPLEKAAPIDDVAIEHAAERSMERAAEDAYIRRNFG